MFKSFPTACFPISIPSVCEDLFQLKLCYLEKETSLLPDTFGSLICDIPQIPQSPLFIFPSASVCLLLSQLLLKYIYFTLIKHYDQGTLLKEGFIWIYNSRGIGVHHSQCREAWQQAGMVTGAASSELTIYTANEKQREWNRNDVWLLNHQSPPLVTYFLQEVPPPKPPLAIPWGSKIKCPRLWGTSHPNYHNLHVQICATNLQESCLLVFFPLLLFVLIWFFSLLLSCFKRIVLWPDVGR